MRTFSNADDRAALLSRFERLTPDALPTWGSMSAARMVVHVTDGVCSALGEVAVAPLKGPLAMWPLNVLVMHYLPWPKSAPTAPELIARAPSDWPSEMAALRSAFDRFGARGNGGTWPRHAAFGDIGGNNWARLMHRHADHHLRQFGR